MRFTAYLKKLPSNKIFVFMLIFLAVIVLSVSLIGWVNGFIKSQQNLLTNSGFELEDTSWLVVGIPSGSEQWQFDSGTRYTGNRSIQLFLAPSEQGMSGIGIQQQISALAERQYELAAKFKYRSFEGERNNAVVLLVKQIGANGQIIRNPNPVFLDPDYSIFERFQPNQEAWFEQSIRFEVDKEARAIEVTLGLFGPSPGSLWVDDVDLKVDLAVSSRPIFPSLVLAFFLLVSAYTLNIFFQPTPNSNWALSLKESEKTRYKYFFAGQIGLILIFVFTFSTVRDWSKQYAWPTLSNWFEQAEAYLMGAKSFEDILVELSPLSAYDSSQTELPVYDLRLTPKSIMQLEGILETIKAQRVLLTKDQIWLDADFVYSDNLFPVQARLRGDLPVHWRGPRKSWRIKFKPDQLLNSKREINLIIPSDKAYISDYTFNYAARNLGLLTLRDQFVILKINGQMPSLYYEVEHFEDELLVANGKPEGPIFTVADTWVQTIKNGFGTASEYYENDTNRTMAEMRSYADIAPGDSTSVTVLYRLIETLFNNPSSISPQQIEPLINMEKYLKYNALRMIFGSFHSSWGNNLKLYFDPTTGKFEPIPWDVYNFKLSFENHTFEKKVAQGGPLDKAVLRNNFYQFQRNQYIWDFLQNDFSEMLDFYDDAFAAVKLYLDSKAQDEIRFYRQNLIDNAGLLRGVLSFSRAFAVIESPAFESDQPEAKPYYRIELLNDSFSPLLLRGLGFKNEQNVITEYRLYLDTNENEILDDADRLLDYIQTSPQENVYRIINIDQIIYSDRDEDMVPVPHPYYFFLVLDGPDPMPLLTDFQFDLENVITGETVGGDFIFTQPVYRQFYADYEAIYQSRESFLKAAPFFQAGRRPLPENAIVLPPDSYTLDKDLIIPRGLKVYIEPGAQILLRPGVSMISYSPIEAIGTEDEPILFSVTDNTQLWGVLGLVLVEEESRFEYVHFNRTGEAKINGIYFSGGLAAHHSNLYISNSQFTDAGSEDALNVKNGQAFIKDTVFRNNAGDAIDLDWAEESLIIGSVFENNAGDAIDLSGTSIPIVNNYIYGSGDKGISVGEMSSPVIFNNFVIKNPIGIAIKDLSEAQILSNTLLENDTSIALYQKKPEFGGGRTQVINTLIWDTQTAIQRDDNSVVWGKYNNIQDGYLDSQSIKPVFNPSDKAYVLDIRNPPELLYEANLSSIRQLTNFKLTRGPIGVLPSVYALPSSEIQNILSQD